MTDNVTIMRSFIISAILLMLPFAISAEKDYTVFLIKGKVELKNDKKAVRLKEKQQLSEDDIISVREGACLVLRSTSEKRHTVTVKTPFEGSVKQLASGDRKGVDRKSRSKEFMDYTYRRSASDYKKDGSYMSGMGTTLRDVFTDKNTQTEASDSIRRDLSDLLQLKGHQSE